MVDLDPQASRSDHESAIADYLTSIDPELGAILVPFVRFDVLESMTDSDRRRMRSEIASKVRSHLDSESDEQ